ncbi:MAG: DUF1648 domain-containing protein [Bacillota bacterium]|jgi:uncharacterized membrane protein
MARKTPKKKYQDLEKQSFSQINHPERKKNRPILKIPRSNLDIALELLSLAGILVLMAIFFINWPTIPSEIPMHFTGDGSVDTWGSKNFLWLFLLLAVGLYIGLLLGGRKPHLFNYSIPITEDNAEHIYKGSVLFFNIVKSILMWIFVVILNAMIKTSLGETVYLGAWMIILISILAITMIAFFVWCHKNR